LSRIAAHTLMLGFREPPIAGMSLISLRLARVPEICFGNPPPHLYSSDQRQRSAISDQRQRLDYVNQKFPEDIFDDFLFGFSSVYIIHGGMKLAHHCKYRAITKILQVSCHDKSENAKRKKSEKYCKIHATKMPCKNRATETPCKIRATEKMPQY